MTDISFGTAGIGNLYRAVDNSDAEAVLRTAWNAGIRYFDTAPFYGFGLAERRIGDFLRVHRGDWVLSTKVGRLLKPVGWDSIPDHGFIEPLPFRPQFDYSYDGVMRSFESSYARLGVNQIDIVWVHDIGSLTHGNAAGHHFAALMSGGMRALADLKAAGTIKAYGLGVNEVQVCLDVMERAPIDAILLAGRYSLLDRSAADKLLPLCEATDTSLVIGGVFNSGILATGAVEGAHFDYGPASPKVIAAVRGLEEVARHHAIQLAAAAIQFPRNQRSVASVLIGTGKASSLARNLDLLNLKLPPQIWNAFEPHTIRGEA